MTEDETTNTSGDPVVPDILFGAEPVHNAKGAAVIMSLWDMLRIDTRPFMTSLTMLAGTIGQYKALLAMGQLGIGFFADSPIEARARVIKAVQDLRKASETLGLETTARLARDACATCENALAAADWYHAIPLQRVVIDLEGLLKAAVAEAESRKFYALGADVKDGYDSADVLFGAQVVDAFPEAAFDVSEAGKCLSFGLWTACVMHTMRVLEIGLRALARHVGIEASVNWNRTLNDIEVALRDIRAKSAGAEAEQQAAEAGTHFRFIKNAWRNHVMHAACKYDEREARQIFGNARAFMKHLADMTNRADR